MKKLSRLQITILMSTIFIVVAYCIFEGLLIAYSNNWAYIASIFSFCACAVLLGCFAFIKTSKSKQNENINKKAKPFYICLLIVASLLFIFEFCTHISYWIHRDAYYIDFLWLGVYFVQFAILAMTCIYSISYCKTGQLRKTAFSLNIASLLVLVVKFFQNLNNIKLIAGEVTPPPQDIATYIIEFAATTILIILFVANFIYLSTKHHFKKSA